MDKPIYPNITEAMMVPFRAIEALLAQNPNILDLPECNYPQSIKNTLRRLLSDEVKTPVEEYSEDELVAEITDLYEELKKTNVSSDVKDNIAMLKTRADLLTKLVTLKERALNARDMARFQKRVIEILENTLDASQRNEFIEKLKSHV